MKVNRGYKYRIYPTKRQIRLIAVILGCCRFVYNRFLNVRASAWADDKKSISYTGTSKMLTGLKQDPDYAWLNDTDSMALQESLRDLDKAYQNFFKKRAGYPRFKSKRDYRKSYRTRCQKNSVRIEGTYIILPKLGAVKAKISRLPNGRILNATVSKTPSGKYFVSLCVEEELVVKPNAGKAIGIDLGLKDLYIDSNGYKEPNPRYLSKYEKKLHREQRSLSRMLEANIAGYTKNRKPIWKRPLSECSNIKKQRLKIARIHEKIANMRTDNLHKASRRLVNENQVIAAESLNVKGMVRNHRLAKAISDASWSCFVFMLEYKAVECGSELIRIPTFYPSSQVCSCCGYKNPSVKDLTVRRWTCPKCGTLHDRDVNAAVNILSKALEMRPAA